VDFSSISVAIDFSAASWEALRQAERLAAPRGTLRLIHVVDAASGLYLDLADLVRGARAELAARAEELRTRFAVELVVESGRPADVIVASSEGSDLLVMGTHGRSALGRLILGSVAEEVTRTSGAPVLVIREGTHEPRRIVVAVDPTSASRDAIAAAASLADRLALPLEAVHGFHAPQVLPYGEPAALRERESVVATHLEKAPDLVRDAVSKAAGRTVKVHVFVGSPAEEITRRLGPGDVLVCGTHARQGTGRFVFGSVATKLLRTAPCAVLVVRPSGRKD
jgi:nucleotide-binding universal stress UspA family protein